MTTLNISKQFTAFEEKRIADVNIKPQHVSLYYCLLLIWSRQKHNPVFRISSAEIMPLSKIGSRACFSKYVRQLTEWGYILAYDRYSNGVLITMNILYTCITNDTPQSYLIEDIDIEEEKDKNPNAPSLEEVIAYYTAAGIDKTDAIRFYYFYQEKNWKLQDGTPIRFWSYVAEKAVKRLLNKKTSSNDSSGKSKYQDPI